MKHTTLISYLLTAILIFPLTACTQQLPASSATTNSTSNISSPHIVRYPSTADYTYLVGKINKLTKTENGMGEIELRSGDLSDVDLSSSYNLLLEATFDSQTIWPDSLPNGFDPNTVMELYKDPGLNVKSLHKKGITGKGVGIGIIDQTLLVEHQEYKDQLAYYEEGETIQHKENGNIFYEDASMHGAAVASIAVGKNTGVAPEATLYYIGENFVTIDTEDHSPLASALNQLLDLNKNLPTANKIRVISISWGNENKNRKGYDEYMSALARAKEEGVFVLTTSLEQREGFQLNGLGKKPLADANDFNSYKPCRWYPEHTSNRLSAPMDYRCIASPTGSSDYVVYPQGGLSWVMPYLAGTYALACQVKPDITPNEFWKVALETSVTNDASLPGIINPCGIIDTLEK